MDAAAKEFFGPNTPHVEDLEKELSLVIYNNHFSLNGPRPLVPGTIEAGGMHIKPSSDPLPKVFKMFQFFKTMILFRTCKNLWMVRRKA